MKGPIEKGEKREGGKAAEHGLLPRYSHDGTLAELFLKPTVIAGRAGHLSGAFASDANPEILRNAVDHFNSFPHMVLGPRGDAKGLTLRVFEASPEFAVFHLPAAFRKFETGLRAGQQALSAGARTTVRGGWRLQETGPVVFHLDDPFLRFGRSLGGEQRNQQDEEKSFHEG